MEIQPKTTAGKHKRGEMRLAVAGGVFTAILSALLGPTALDLLKDDPAHTHEIMGYVVALVVFACLASLYLMKLAYADIDNVETNESLAQPPNQGALLSHSACSQVITIEHGTTRITIHSNSK